MDVFWALNICNRPTEIPIIINNKQFFILFINVVVETCYVGANVYII